MIDKIKEDMEGHIGEKVKIIFNGGRNKKEEYEATITELYKFIFVVRVSNETNDVKTFTYSDVLTQTIEIFYK